MPIGGCPTRGQCRQQVKIEAIASSVHNLLDFCFAVMIRIFSNLFEHAVPRRPSNNPPVCTATHSISHQYRVRHSFGIPSTPFWAMSAMVMYSFSSLTMDSRASIALVISDSVISDISTESNTKQCNEHFRMQWMADVVVGRSVKMITKKPNMYFILMK